MASKKVKLSPKASLPFKIANKYKRQDLHIKQKKARDGLKRDEKFRRKREENRDSNLRDERIKKNIPLTLDRKRTWDQVDRDTGDGLGVSVDIERLTKEQEAASPGTPHMDGEPASDAEAIDDDRDSMMDSASENDVDNDEEQSSPPPAKKALRGTTRSPKSATERATSPTHSTTSTNLDLNPAALAARFPTLFATPNPATPSPAPKILITTSINSTLHTESRLLSSLFPHSNYIPRSSHRHSHKYSLREIARFATSRLYTSILVLKEDSKRPTGLSIIHLPSGPTFHFSISNWIEGRRLPGHGNPTTHSPELILNNFRTPLGLLTAHVFRSLFPPVPEFEGRQVVTLHNQRDYIFLRRHRYVFREKRETEKNVVGADGREVPGVQGLRAGLQELGPRFTLKLRRVDKGIQRGGGGGQEAGVEWEWKGDMEKTRTKFQL
ncbi:hypothetical protein MMC09_006072 [Bachmanniomyces sp. S44760]|nr:hypothetical protein [Bachmanniomyces sp. S44760]